MPKEPMQPNTQQATVKDFLIYLVKKGILPKEAVQKCRERKQDAIRKGYTISVKDILLEQGYIVDETEYQKLWRDMQDSYKIRRKLANNYNANPDSFSLSENVLQELISDESFQRERHPEVPTDVILTVYSRWKDQEDEDADAASPNGVKVPGDQAAAQPVHQGIYSKIGLYFNLAGGLFAAIVVFWLLLLVHDKFGFPFRKYWVQKIHMQIPAVIIEKNSIIEGKLEQLSQEQLLEASFSPKTNEKN